MRLGCALWTPDAADLVIEVPDSTENLKIQMGGEHVAIQPDAVIKHLTLGQALFKSAGTAAYEKLIVDYLEKECGLSPVSVSRPALQQLARIVCDSQESGLIELTVWNDRDIISVKGGRSTGPYGIAVDLGTTTVVCYLLDLNDGRIVSIASSGNTQATMGDDLMTRISVAMEDEKNVSVLQSFAVETLNGLIRECCDATGIEPEDIYECCCAGNTCMQHLFLGLSPQSLGFSPYRPVTMHGTAINAGELQPSLLMNRAGKIYVLPAIAGFVGGDNVCAQLTVHHLDSDAGVRLLLDIGTNTEIALIDREGAMVCSCPSGPAFEGMHITHGVRGTTGAIERISIIPGSMDVHYGTIGNKKPIGICGSGLVDAVAGLLKAGLLKRNGVLKGESPSSRLRMGSNGEREFVLAWKEETDLKKDIVITQSDIVEFQKAKAAIQAACTILLHKRNLAEHQIGKIFIAGTFGQYIDPENAIATGMLPSVPLDRIQVIGNAAGTGARMVLISREARREAEEIAKQVEYLDLSADSEFTQGFMQSMFFPLLH